MPPDQAVRSVRSEDPWKELNPRNGQENEPSGARHPTENDEALSKLGGLKGLEHTLSEQTSQIGNARTDAATTTIKNGLVFTELDTLMTVAWEAIGQVRTSARLTETTQN